MARVRNRLTSVAVGHLKKVGVYADGGGLRLQITRGVRGDLRRSWVLRFRAPCGRVREMGLGVVEEVSLAQARLAAEAARNAVRGGVDPIEAKKETRARAVATVLGAVTFKECAEAYLSAHERTWRNDKHRRQWRSSLEAYAYPVFGDLPVGLIDVTHVTRALDPIWASKTETANRVRQRTEAILDWAAVRGYRSGDNPARWKGHLAMAFPPRAKAAPVRHHPALPFAEAPTFMRALRSNNGVGSRALEFAVLTASRTSEVLGARWSEIDLHKKVWVVPPQRMKANREHRVPLSTQALALLTGLDRDPASDIVFLGRAQGGTLSSMAFLMVLRRMKRADLTAHGFRSTFRDWVAETTDHAREVAEGALAHAVGDQTEAAYRRGDLFEKRRRLMQDWADYAVGATVTAMKRQA